MKLKGVQVGTSPSHPPLFDLPARKFSSKFVQALTRCMVVSSLFVAAPALGGVVPSHNLAQPDVQIMKSNLQSDETGYSSVASSAINPALSQEIASLLLGICYFGLPVSMALAIWSYDRRTHDRLAQLKEQIDLLERIWHQNPQS